MKNLLSRQYFLSAFVLLLALSQGASQLSATPWSNSTEVAQRGYLNSVGQPGNTNAQLINELNHNLTPAIPAANNARFINEATSRLHVDPKADENYFIPKQYSPEYTAAATPGIQAVATALETLNRTLTAKTAALEAEVPTAKTTGTEAALQQCATNITAAFNAAVVTALNALAGKLAGEFLTVYNQNPAALNGIPAVDALLVQTRNTTTLLTPRIAALVTVADNMNQLCAKATAVHAAAQAAEQEKLAGNLAGATAAAAAAQADATVANRIATTLGLTMVATPAQAIAPIIVTITTELAAAQASAQAAGALHGAVDAPTDAAVALFAKPLVDYATEATPTLDAATITAKYALVGENIVRALKGNLVNAQKEAFLALLTVKINAGRMAIERTITASGKTAPEKATLKAHLNVTNNEYVREYMKQAIKAITQPDVATLTMDILKAKATELKTAAEAAEVAADAAETVRINQKWFLARLFYKAKRALFGRKLQAPAPVVAPAVAQVAPALAPAPAIVAPVVAHAPVVAPEAAIQQPGIIRRFFAALFDMTPSIGDLADGIVAPR